MTSAAKSTNIELDRDLLDRARTVLGGANIKDTVEEGLRRILSEQALREFAACLTDLDPQQRDLLTNVRDTTW